MQLVEQFPIVFSLLAFLGIIFGGTVDLIVLKNRAIAILIWVMGFPVVVGPIFTATAWGDIRWVLGAAVSVAYVAVTVATYRILAPNRKADDSDGDVE